MILAIDPGRDKCGFALLSEDGAIIEKKIVSRPAVISEIAACLQKFPVTAVVMGEAAAGRQLSKELGLAGVKANLVFVGERNSTELARKNYWREHPPQGLWRLVPTSFRVTPVPVDDYAAAIIGQRYLNRA